MKVVTLVRYELNESRPLGVITAVAEYKDPKTGKKYKTYRVHWNNNKSPTNRVVASYYENELTAVSS